MISRRLARLEGRKRTTGAREDHSAHAPSFIDADPSRWRPAWRRRRRWPGRRASGTRRYLGVPPVGAASIFQQGQGNRSSASPAIPDLHRVGPLIEDGVYALQRTKEGRRPILPSRRSKLRLNIKISAVPSSAKTTAKITFWEQSSYERQASGKVAFAGSRHLQKAASGTGVAVSSILRLRANGRMFYGSAKHGVTTW